MNQLIKSTIIVLLSLSIFACQNDQKTEKYEVDSTNFQLVPIDKKLKGSSEIDEFILPYAKQIDKEMNQVLSLTKKPMFKTDSKFNTAIGNMMADAVFERIQPIAKEKFDIQLDGVLLNYGGIRSGISEGDITVKTAYDIMPFENEVVIVELSYEKVQELFSYLAKAQVAHPIAGMQLEIDHLAEITHQEFHSKKLKEEETYFIATSDYLLKGGDQMNFFIDNENVFETNYKLRNLLIDYFDSKDEIKATKDQRFIKK